MQSFQNGETHTPNHFGFPHQAPHIQDVLKRGSANNKQVALIEYERLPFDNEFNNTYINWSKDTFFIKSTERIDGTEGVEWYKLNNEKFFTSCKHLALSIGAFKEIAEGGSVVPNEINDFIKNQVRVTVVVDPVVELMSHTKGLITLVASSASRKGTLSEWRLRWEWPTDQIYVTYKKITRSRGATAPRGSSEKKRLQENRASERLVAEYDNHFKRLDAFANLFIGFSGKKKRTFNAIVKLGSGRQRQRTRLFEWYGALASTSISGYS
jgi:hypothetical protein